MQWTKDQIREARQAPLLPLLLHLGHSVQGLPEDNFAVRGMDDLVVKAHYWRWPSRNIEGNTIDFLVKVQGQTFQQAMQLIHASRQASVAHQPPS